MSSPDIVECGLGKTVSRFQTCQPKGPPSNSFTVIPSLVRQRIPFIRSIRCSTQQESSPHTRILPSLPSSQSGSTLDRDDHSEYSVTTSSGSSTPPTPSNPEESEVMDPNNLLETNQNSLLPACHQTIGGVNWDRAFLGVQIGQTAVRQLQSNTKPTTLREMYLDAVRYMLLSLPSDLTESEVCRLHQSLPEAVRMDENETAIRVGGNNFIRKATAQTVYGIIAIVFFLLPVVMSILNRMIRYERQHHLTERAIDNCASMLQNLSNKDSNFNDMLSRLKASAIGTFLSGMLVWIIQSIAAGVNDGLLASSYGNSRLLKNDR